MFSTSRRDRILDESHKHILKQASEDICVNNDITCGVKSEVSFQKHLATNFSMTCFRGCGLTEF